MKKTRYKCPTCGCYLKIEMIKSTKEEIDECNYPEEFATFYCSKCKEYVDYPEEVEE
jgi:hypothetical protein